MYLHKCPFLNTHFKKCLKNKIIYKFEQILNSISFLFYVYLPYFSDTFFIYTYCLFMGEKKVLHIGITLLCAYIYQDFMFFRIFVIIAIINIFLLMVEGDVY